jgi:hypothetical protein
MATAKGSPALRSFGFATILIALAGAGFFRWVPMGIVLSLFGIILGLTRWTIVRRHSPDTRLALVGIVLNLAALCLDVVTALRGLQTLTFGALWGGERPPG